MGIQILKAFLQSGLLKSLWPGHGGWRRRKLRLPRQAAGSESWQKNAMEHVCFFSLKKVWNF